jgi:hypothetical protein
MSELDVTGKNLPASYNQKRIIFWETIMHEGFPELALMIPIIAILTGLGIALAAFKHTSKRREMEHRERMAAIEKGLPLPQIPTMPVGQAQMMMPVKQRNPYLWGFILLGAGLAVIIAKIVEGNEDLGWGLVMLFVGMAILAANLLFTRQPKQPL